MARQLQRDEIPIPQLPEKIAAEVQAWRNQGYHPFPSETTRQLLSYWFDRDHEAGEQFYECQRHAIETIIYCHEVRGVRTLRQLYEEFAPEVLAASKTVADEADSIPFMKYCLKMATGSGKTWVLGALLTWQYFNATNGETNAPYSRRFLVVTPGVEVLNRLLDSFKGKRNPKTRQRDPQTSDYNRPLFMPGDIQWRGQFDLQVLEPSDIRANAPPPDGPFVALLNWQQFTMTADAPSLGEQFGLSIPEEPRGEIIADFLTQYPDLVIMNDEAHHVHGKGTVKGEELVWRRFMKVLDERGRERHGENRGLFLQMDFSATPFYGSAHKREYFPHIVYDYDLREALNERLVKQVFLEERQALAGQPLEELNYRAEREPTENGKRGEVTGLSTGQKQILDIAVNKLNQLTKEFQDCGIDRKPVLMVLAEDTTVADRVYNHLLTSEDHRGGRFVPRSVLLFHSELEKGKHGYTIEEARGKGQGDRDIPTLEKIDDDSDPLRIVVSVLALREGFDKTNIAVVAVLRATEADLLLEQIVGRGLRLMFPAYRYPELEEAKIEAFNALQKGGQPQNSFDFLYIVEHPRFRAFYDELKGRGYLIGSGDTSRTTATGDIIPVDAAPERIPERDIAWPVAVQEEVRQPDLSAIPIKDLPSGTWDLDQVRQVMQNIAVTDRHLETDTRAKTWGLRDRFFDYAHFLRIATDDIAKRGRTNVLTARKAEIAGLVDEYTTHRLFGQSIDFRQEENYKVLAYQPIRDYVVATIRKAISDLLDQPRYEVRRGLWKRLSDLPRIFVRQSVCVPARKCIYPTIGYPIRFGGFERRVMENLLDKSGEVRAWCKLQKKHGLEIPYRDASGVSRTYEVDFLVRTDEGCYLLETKADKDLTLPNVGLKARAARSLCEYMSGVKCETIQQPDRWEYMLLNESTYDANEGQSFQALLPLMRQVRDQVIAQQFHGSLFVR
ncbi:MAG: DEAD/DEAH box helicase family protein [Planctomycetota bacterium]|nr:DEAD/DEAH box helicase family protein [Planctomycetota bacterium]